MVSPRVVPRAEHALSRRDIDADALKVLYRLRQFDHTAYLVGGSVRDLLIARRPKDFDIGTSAHPYQVKKLFRNCWIIGRRFRLAHVRFGSKVIEVATFRRQVEAAADEAVPADAGVPLPADVRVDPEATIGQGEPAADHYVHRDNTFGTPEEDAFRRDFTINALFYDINTFSIIDYVGGLEDLQAGIVRSIGDPEIRFREDPVRMLRAVALAARLDFAIDPDSLAAVGRQRTEIARSSPARLLEEYYKILRAGASERTFRDLARLGLLEPISAELQNGADLLGASLAAIDRYRRGFASTPETLSNAVLLGSLLVPLGLARRPPHASPSGNGSQPPAGPRLGLLPLARRDIERLHQILELQRRLRDLNASPRAQHSLVRRSAFRDALTWLEIHTPSAEIVDHWTALAGRPDIASESAPEGETAEARPLRRRRRRRRRRFQPTPH